MEKFYKELFGGFKALSQPANLTLGPHATLI